MALHPNGEAVAAFEPIQPIRTWGEGPAIQNQLLESLMKKVLLISASVLALSAGAAFAQNYQSTYQNGTGNTVGVDQTGNGGSNSSTILQGAYSSGANNSSVSVTQIGGTGSATNSYAQQDGSSLSATVSQTAYAGGSHQNSSVIQSGDSNTATVTQSAPSSSATEQSSVNQSSNGYWGANNVTVNQSGVNDSSTVNQSSGGTGGGTQQRHRHAIRDFIQRFLGQPGQRLLQQRIRHSERRRRIQLFDRQPGHRRL